MCPARDASVHQAPQGGRQRATISIHQRLGCNRDARGTLDARRRTYNDPRGARRGYHPRCGGRYDSSEDRSSSPGLPGPQAFSRHVLNAAFPLRYRPPTNIPKYSGETNPGLWLKDYRLACQAGGASDDDFIIHNLPLFLSDTARAWLEHLPSNDIQSWADLTEIFVGNFQGMYKCPGNPWDLKNCRQKADETLCGYIRCFSR